MNRREFLQQSAIIGMTAGRGSRPLPAQARSSSGSLSFKAAFAERDVTPDVGMEMPGDYFKTFLRGFHDRCKVRAAVFDDGTTRVALVGTDSEMIPRDLVKAARKEIQERCGIPPEAVMVGASHSHSSGPIGDIQPGQYDHASSFIRHLAYDVSPMADPGYLKRVEEQIVNAVCEANSSLVEAWCGIGTGSENKVAFNRRFRMKNGLTYTDPGQGNPDINGYAGPTDPQVGVIGSWDKDGHLLGCVVNYTCHATTNPGRGDDISANWIYYLEETIRGAMGAEVPVVYLQGACGDITQVDNLSPYAYPHGERWARFVGGRLGGEAVKVLLSVEPGSLAPLDARSKTLHIKRRVPSPAHVQQANELVKQDRNTMDRTKWVFAKETVLLDALLKEEPAVEVEVQAIQIGPAVFVSNPAELFCQYGLDLKAKSAFPHTFCVSYANGYVGYVPTEEAFGPHGGGYETRLTSVSNLEITAGSQMVRSGLELVAQMTPGKVPGPPKAQPFSPGLSGIGSHPWSYGDVTPELD